MKALLLFVKSHFIHVADDSQAKAFFGQRNALAIKRENAIGIMGT